jgi:hypothetical protein
LLSFSFFTYKCYSTLWEHYNPLGFEYSFWSVTLPSIGLNGPAYSPPGFSHPNSAYNTTFWAQYYDKVEGTLSCGYRCVVRNHQVGGKPASFHMYGCAADVTGQAEAELAPYFPFHQTETNPPHVHIDWRTR